MELGKQQYQSIMMMPVQRLTSYLKWKIKYDEEIAAAKRDALEKELGGKQL